MALRKQLAADHAEADEQTATLAQANRALEEDVKAAKAAYCDEIKVWGTVEWRNHRGTRFSGQVPPLQCTRAFGETELL